MGKMKLNGKKKSMLIVVLMNKRDKYYNRKEDNKGYKNTNLYKKRLKSMRMRNIHY